MSLENSNSYDDLFKHSSSEERAQKVHHLFSKIARRYDFMNRFMSLGLDLRWRRIAVNRTAFPGGSRILDLGAGSGDFALKVIQNIPESQVIGYDICRDLMALGQEKIIKANLSHRMIWLQGDGRKLPFKTASVDGVIAGFSVRNIPDTPTVFFEVFRVLKPDGKFVLLDMVQPTNPILRFLFKIYFKYTIPILGKILGSDPEAYAYLYPSIVNFYSAQKINRAFRETGFRDVQSKNYIMQMICITHGQR